MQDKTEGEFFMQRLRTPSTGYDSPPLWLSRIWASPARHLWHYLFHFWPLVQTLECGPTVGTPWSSSTPPSLGRGRVAPPPPGFVQNIAPLSLSRDRRINMKQNKKQVLSPRHNITQLHRGMFTFCNLVLDLAGKGIVLETCRIRARQSTIPLQKQLTVFSKILNVSLN